MRIDTLLRKMLTERSDLRETTKVSYRVEIAKLGAFLKRQAASLRPAELERWAGGDQSRRRAVRALKTLLNWGVRYGYVDNNPVASCRGPRIRTMTHRMGLNAAWDTPGLFPVLRDRALVTLLLDTGLRAREALALDWEHVDLDAGTVRVERSVNPRGQLQPLKVTGRERTLALTPTTVELLRQLLPKISDGRPVFRNRWGTRLDLHNWHSRVWRPAIKRAGLQLRIHDLRHACATALVLAGEPGPAVAGRLGHAAVSTTFRFYLSSQPALSSVGSQALAARLQSRA